MRPLEVDRMATPSPLRTRGISPTATYFRSPGLDTRLSSRITGCPPCAYFSTTRSSGRPASDGTVRKSVMKLFSFSRRAISSFNLDAGVSTRRCFDPQALRMRVNMSATGSVMLIGCVSLLWYPGGHGRTSRNWGKLPAGLAHAGNQPEQRHLAERDAGEPELADVPARASRHRTAVPDAFL